MRWFGVGALPSTSAARWFRWKESCPGARPKPPDDYDDLNGYTGDWVWSDDARACYFAQWGGTDSAPFYGGQPTADLTSPEWVAEVQRILAHWVVERGVDGFLLDAPPDYLAVAEGMAPELSRPSIAKAVRSVIVDPVRASSEETS